MPNKIIDKISNYCRKELAFEKRLKQDSRTPDMFNQGRFYTCQNILDIINGKEEIDE